MSAVATSSSEADEQHFVALDLLATLPGLEARCLKKRPRLSMNL
jgi:hypothetical protein